MNRNVLTRKTKILLTLWVISVLTTSFVTYTIAQSATDFTLSQGIYPGAPAFTIWREGSTYFSKSAYGLVTSGTNATALWEDVRDNGLTAGRTTKEKVVFKGTITLDSPIFVISADYTIIEIQGKITFSSGVNASVIDVFADHVEIRGGEIDGDKANNPNTWIGFAGIKIFTSTDVLIEGVYVHDHANSGVQVTTSTFVRVVDCYLYNNGRNGIGFISGTAYSTMEHNTAYNNTINGFWDAGSVGLPNRENLISNNIAWDNEYGIFVDAFVSGSSVVGNVVENNDLDGIVINGDSTDPGGGDPADFDNTTDITVVGNHATSNGGSGILVSYTNNVSVTANHAFNHNFDGVRLLDSLDCYVSGNTLRRNAYGVFEGTDVRGCDNNSIIGNDARYNRNGGVFIAGVNSRGWLNEGQLANLDMEQQLILNAVFHNGTSFPTSPVQGQYFWRTDLDALYVYNSTNQWQPMAGSGGAQGPAGPTGESGHGTASYIVFQNSTATYLQNGNTSQIDDSSSDPTDIINWAIGNLTNGGLVWIRQSEYITTDPIIMSSNVHLKLESGTIINQTDTGNLGTMHTLLKADDGAHDFTVEGGTWDVNEFAYSSDPGNYSNEHGFFFRPASGLDADKQYDYTIKDLTILNAVYFGIYNSLATGYLIENVETIDCGNNGIVVEGKPSSAFPYYFVNATVRGCKISGSGDVGINTFYARNVRYINIETFDNDDPGARSVHHSRWNIGVEKGTDVFIVGLHSWGNCVRTFQVDSLSANIQVIGGIITDTTWEVKGNNTHFSGVNFYSDGLFSSSTTWYLSWTDCIFYEVNVPVTFRHASFINNLLIRASNGQGITLTSNAQDVLIEGNTFINTRVQGTSVSDVMILGNDFSQAGSPAISFATSTNIKIKDNLGFVTENSGGRTVANSETFAHSLHDTPTVVQLTCANSTYDGVPVLIYVDWANTDATNISVDVYWTNGTAIADDVIYVLWEAKTWFGQ